MTTSQGRVGRRGRSWLATTLAASGFCLLAPVARPTLACHIHHHDAASSTAKDSAAATAAVAAQSLQPDANPWTDPSLMHPMQPAPATAAAAAVAPTAADSTPARVNYIDQFGRVSTLPTPYAASATKAVFVDYRGHVSSSSMAAAPTVSAQVLSQAAAASLSPSATVQEWHHSSASNLCTTPPPPCSCGSSSSAATQSLAPPTPLQPPASLLSSPTPAPEPSTILTALGLAGAFAWRLRATGRRS